MEELIWKYIDNQCTADEQKKVNELLQNDPSFASMYQEIVRFDTMLSENTKVSLRPKFRDALIQDIEKQCANQATYISVPKDIIPVKWWLVAAVIVIGTILLTIKLPVQSSLLADIKIPLDERTLTLATWSMVGFLCLTLVDVLLKNRNILRKNSFFVV